MRGRSNEMAEVMSRYKVDICSLQEVRWRGASARLVEQKDSRFKLLWVGNDEDIGGVGIFFCRKMGGGNFDVSRVLDKILLFKLVLGKSIVTVLSTYDLS